MKTVNWIVLGVVVAFVGYSFYALKVPPALAFKPLTPQAYAGLVAWLLAVALFAERAVEVVTMVFRDEEADALENASNNAGGRSEALAKNAAAGQPERDAAAKAAGDARALLTAYRAKTKEIALLTSFILGILISLAGVRALASLLADSAKPGRLFEFLDIFTTGLVIAGGSEGIHQMANVFSGFMDSLTAQANRAQKQAESSTPKP